MLFIQMKKMANKKYTIPKNQILEHERDLKKMDIGFLGKFFGGENNISRNVGGFIAFIIIFLIGIIIVLNKNIEFIKLLIPVLTLIIGYLLGQKINQN